MPHSLTPDVSVPPAAARASTKQAKATDKHESPESAAARASLATLLAALNPEQRAAAEHGITVPKSATEAMTEARSPAYRAAGKTPEEAADIGTGVGDGAAADTAADTAWNSTVPIGGPLLVIAGAGTGKTATLAHRVANLLHHGAQPDTILLLTFSRRAAVEMNRRVERITHQAGLRHAMGGAGGVGLPWAGTFHAVGARLLREYAPFIGLAPTFTISDRADAADLMNLVRHDQGLTTKSQRFPTKQTCLSIYSRAVNTEASLDAVLAESFPWCAQWEAELQDLFAAYVEAKQAQQVLDYDDLLLYWAQMATEPTIAADLSRRFEHVLVDEYQDTNRLQASLLLRIKPSGQGVTVVGDDAQSIYAFRGATVRNILDFPSAFSTPAHVITLERNYRSLPPILAASNAVIDLASERFTKALWTEQTGGALPEIVTVADEVEQARFVATRILEHRENGLTLKSQAVLFRASDHSAALEIELTRRNLPFVKFGGLKFLDASHVKDMLAAFRWMQNPRDRVAGFRVLQLMPGVGPVTAGKALDALDAANATANANAPSDVLVSARLPAAPREIEGWEALAELMSRIHLHPTEWPLDFALVRAWYMPHLERLHDDAAVRSADLDQLEQIAATFPTRERFLTELTLDPPDASSDESGVPLKDEDYLILSTIHSAKGQEWPAVFLLNAVDGCLPSDLATGSSAEIDEERRLLYVAMTRAKSSLTIVTPHRFYVHQQVASGDRHVYASRTRFIPPRLLNLFSQTVWPPAAAPTDQGRLALAAVKLDIAAKMRGMWGK